MSTKYTPPEELRELLSVLREGDLTPADSARLDKLLADPQARQYYVQYTHLCADLQWLSSEEVQQQVLDQLGIAQGGHADVGSAVLPQPAEMQVTRGWSRWSLAAAVMLSASVAAVLGALGARHWMDVNQDLAQQVADQEEVPVAPDQSDADQSDPDDSDVVAWITRKVDCVRSDERWAVESSSKLRLGQTLEIDSGLIEFQYKTGVRVILQGPARYTTDQPNGGYLHFGTLSAEVPDGAEGFAVVAPETRLVDHGTSFGLRVEELGDAEVHVFDGEVTVERLDEQGNPRSKPVSLLEDQTVRYSRTAAEPQSLASPTESFSRSLEQVGESYTVPDLQVHRSLALWLAADCNVRKGPRSEGDRFLAASAWGDILAGDNQKAENAWQVKDFAKPLWIADGLNGKPCLRFDGISSGMIVSPLETKEDLTVFIVFDSHGSPYSQRPLPARTSRGQLLQLVGSPTVLVEQLYGGNELRTRMSFGAGSAGQPSSSGLMTAASPPEDQPVLLSYSYAHSENEAELFVNGSSQGKADAEQPASGKVEPYIGCHNVPHMWNFCGDIAEIIVYNSALTEGERTTVQQYLNQKYALWK